MSENTLITQIQNRSLQIFIEFQKICKRNNLRYFMIGGSCLGAVRHCGFIPWDDDIDIGMPRKDYEKFLKIAHRELPEYLFLQNHFTDKEYIFNFSKIRDSRTSFIEKSVEPFDINHGLYIDIFPLDGYKSSRKFDLLNKLLNARVYCRFRKNKFKNLIIIILSLCIAQTSERACEKRDTLLKSIDYDDSEIIANFCGAWGIKEIVPREYFGDGIEVTFEHVKVIIPEKYDLYLKQLYGNYLKLPPEEKRITHHETTVIDLNKSYLEYR